MTRWLPAFGGLSTSPPLVDEAADEALPSARVLGSLADGEQLTGRGGRVARRSLTS